MLLDTRAPLGTVITAMVTPMTEDFQVDWDGAVQLLEHLVANGSDGVVIAGTTGEAPTLTDDEQIELIRLAVETVGGRICVIAGAGANDTAHAVRLTERSSAAGADAILSVTPYYNRPNEAGIHAHFAAVAGASELPVVLYNIPGRTGTDMPDELSSALAERNPTITAIKQARPGVPQPIAGLQVYAGDDERFAEALDAGAAAGAAARVAAFDMPVPAISEVPLETLGEILVKILRAMESELSVLQTTLSSIPGIECRRFRHVAARIRRSRAEAAATGARSYWD
jgi:4-hydroxy-tetrahydrodipicolinate synthase